MKKLYKYLILLLIVLSFNQISCTKKNDEISGKTKGIDKPEHTYGDLKITLDPSYKNVIKALTDMYKIEYPDVNFTFDYQREDVALKELYEGNTSFAIVSKPLTKDQEDYLFNKTKILYKASPIAMDAAIFITSVNNPIDSISIKDIKENLYKDNPSFKFIFDYPNSANFNTVNTKLGINPPKDKSVTAAETEEKVIDFLQKDTKAIGIIGLNTLSDTDNPAVEEYLKKVKILKIVNDKGETIAVNNQNLRNGSYPFYRMMYFLKNEIGYGLAAGFTRFAGSQQGQLIVLKENLQPYYLYKREIKINNNPIIK